MNHNLESLSLYGLWKAWASRTHLFPLITSFDRVLWARFQKEMGGAWNVLQVCYLVIHRYLVIR